MREEGIRSSRGSRAAQPKISFHIVKLARQILLERVDDEVTPRDYTDDGNVDGSNGSNGGGGGNGGDGDGASDGGTRGDAKTLVAGMDGDDVAAESAAATCELLARGGVRQPGARRHRRSSAPDPRAARVAAAAVVLGGMEENHGARRRKCATESADMAPVAELAALPTAAACPPPPVCAGTQLGVGCGNGGGNSAGDGGVNCTPHLVQRASTAPADAGDGGGSLRESRRTRAGSRDCSHLSARKEVIDNATRAARNWRLAKHLVFGVLAFKNAGRGRREQQPPALQCSGLDGRLGVGGPLEVVSTLVVGAAPPPPAPARVRMRTSPGTTRQITKA